MHYFGWTEARVATLRQEWINGLSASQIAKMLGGGVSRNAVIGKIHRLKLVVRATPTRATKAFARTRRDKVVHLAKRKKPPAAPLNLRAIAELEPCGPLIEHARTGQCRYIRDEPGTPICGRPVAGESSWCSLHAQLVYQRAPEPVEAAVAA